MGMSHPLISLQVLKLESLDLSDSYEIKKFERGEQCVQMLLETVK